MTNVLFLPEDVAGIAAPLGAVASGLAPRGGIILARLNGGSAQYWDGAGWRGFGAEGESEDPRTYVSVARAAAALLVRRVAGDGDVRLALWVHPDAHAPLDRYKGMTGSRFPGSPGA